jgi:ubiquinone/menaquinone biosynthesis C-methylase UbiE
MENKCAEFDKFAEDYNQSIINDLGKLGKYRNSAFIYKINCLKNILREEPKSILDFGCGIGSFIPYLHDSFTNSKLYGCDISSKSIEIVKNNAVMLSPKYCKRLLLNRFYNTESGDKEILLKKDNLKLKYTYFFL